MRRQPLGDPYPTLSSSRRRTFALAGVASAFVALGCVLVATGQLFVGWLSITFFGACLVVGLLLLVMPGTLALSPEGMRVRHLGQDWPLLAWDNCSDFTVWEPPAGPALVVFTYSGPPLRWKPGMAVRGTKALTGGNAALPDTYGLTAEELARLLERARRASLRKKG